MQMGKSFRSSLLIPVLLLGTTACSQAPKPVNEMVKPVYPLKNIEMVVGYTAGGGTDVVARIVAKTAEKYMPNGKTIRVTNKPGDSGTNALVDIMQANPDGYKLGSVSAGSLAIQPNYGKTPFASDSFIPIAQFNSAPNILVVRADAPWKSYDEWLAWVKQHPGQFTYGSSGAGNTQHLAMEAVNILESIQTKHVPYDGAALSIKALLDGYVQGVIVLSQEAKPHVDAGSLRVLANLGTSPTKAYPDAVFLRQRGFIGLDTWSGVVVAKGTPQEIVDTLRDVFRKAMNDPLLKEEFNNIGLEPAYADSKEFAEIIARTSKLTRDVAKVIGLVK